MTEKPHSADDTRENTKGVATGFVASGLTYYTTKLYNQVAKEKFKINVDFCAIGSIVIGTVLTARILLKKDNDKSL